MKVTIGLNSDIGESFGPWIIGDGVDNEIISLVSEVNIATGFHAGDPVIIRNTVRESIKNGVAIGAHPGFRDLFGFGRRMIVENPEVTVNEIIYQLGALREFVKLEGGKIFHLKPHGALYATILKNEDLAKLLVETSAKIDSNMPIYTTDRSPVLEYAKKAGIPVVKELIADREYGDDGHFVLVKKAIEYTPEFIAQKCLKACKEGKVTSINGKEIDIDFDSICIHSDTKGALALVQKTKEILLENNIKVEIPKV